MHLYGSPPRAWGRQHLPLLVEVVNRFTPTCMGTTSSCGSSVRRAYGSPPRAWGRRHNNLLNRVEPRFTPTCMGTTPSSSESQRSGTVHPHVHGDDAALMAATHFAAGSPPRAWGRRMGRCTSQNLRRFTPTCMGTTPRSSPATPPAAVHPHVHGDDVLGTPRVRYRTRFTPTCMGTTSDQSPTAPVLPVHPHVHGDDETICSEFISQIRFTPTCMGTTTYPTRNLRGATVHPHVHGDDCSSYSWPCCIHGSPPRAWGRRMFKSSRRLKRRFTPTCMGTTPRLSPRCPTPAVHPHVHGDDGRTWMQRSAPCGSPPRAWGRRSGPA